jgi:hypothetical protein
MAYSGSVWSQLKNITADQSISALEKSDENWNLIAKERFRFTETPKAKEPVSITIPRRHTDRSFLWGCWKTSGGQKMN